MWDAAEAQGYRKGVSGSTSLLREIDAQSHFIAAVFRSYAELNPSWKANTYEPYFLPHILPIFTRLREFVTKAPFICERCEGKGKLTIEGMPIETCPACGGTGKAKEDASP